MKKYGTGASSEEFEGDQHLENLRINGYSIEPKIFDHKLCDEMVSKLRDVYQVQEEEISSENMEKIKDLNIARMPFMYDPEFSKLFMHPFILDLADKFLGKTYYLHLQNGILNRPDIEHHQTSWHRDLPYQNWTSSKPFGLNAFVCLTEFSARNGATYVLPHSQRIDSFPGEPYIINNELQLIAEKGSVIFFDSMIFHRAGFNQSDSIRVGVNNMFVLPFIRQQIDIASCAHTLTEDPDLLRILGAGFPLDRTVKEYRLRKLRQHG